MKFVVLFAAFVIVAFSTNSADARHHGGGRGSHRGILRKVIHRAVHPLEKARERRSERRGGCSSGNCR